MITVRVPATSANLGPGFDALGLALRIHNTLTLEPAQEPEIEIEGEGAGVLPRDASHLAYQAAMAVLARSRDYDVPVDGPLESIGGQAFRLRQHNRIPLSRGMGSSAAAIIAGAVGANALLGGPLDQQAIVDLATELEGHPDNVTPALLGGLVVCTRGASGVRWMRLAPPPLKVVLVVPDYHVSTPEARRRLPARVPFPDAVFNVTRAALLVAALTGGRPDLLDEATQDRLHQPYREQLVPGLSDVFSAARDAGAYGVALSGSGPAVLAFGEAPDIGPAMARAFEAAGAACRILHAECDIEGAVVEGSA